LSLPAEVEAVVDAVPDPGVRADSRAFATLVTEVTGEPAWLGSPKIIGFGRCHWRYPTGREGDSAKVGFSPTPRGLTVYLMSGFVGYDDILGRLGRHSIGKSCLYLRRLEDVDGDALRALIDRSVRHIDQTVAALGALPRMSDMPPFEA